MKKRSLDVWIIMFVNIIFIEYYNYSIFKIYFVIFVWLMVEYLKVCVYGIDVLNNYNVVKKINWFIVIILYGVY